MTTELKVSDDSNDVTNDNRCKCWTDGSCCCYSRCASRTQFICYNMVNSIRFIIIAILIYFANHYNIEETKDVWLDCCNCYYISQNPGNYSNDLSYDTRFDLSMCIPHCTDCNYCKTRFNNSAQQSFDYDGKFCPIPAKPGSQNYTSPNSMWAWNWYQKTGCHDRISLTAFFVIAKSYRSYQIWSCVVILFYVFVLLILTFLVYPKPKLYWQGAENQFSAYVLVYNALIAEISLYLTFKPYQYWDKTFEVNNESITCPISSTANSTRIWIVVMIFGIICFVIIHVFMECVQIHKLRKRITKDIKNEENTVLLHGQHNLKNSKHYNWLQIRIVFGVLFFLWALIFFIVLMVAMYEMFDSYWNNNNDDREKKHSTRILSTISLIFPAIFDALFCGLSRKWLYDQLMHITEYIPCCDTELPQHAIQSDSGL